MPGITSTALPPFLMTCTTEQMRPNGKGDLTLELVRNVTRSNDNLPANFGISETFL